MASWRTSVLFCLVATLPQVCTVAGQTTADTRLTAGQNVNMVSGRAWPHGDPFLQRQDEPSLAVSTRNPMHLVAGANDYRTVDLPGLPVDSETGDAWLGLYKSYDGGQSWISTLLPGFPQDQSEEGVSSPLKGLDAGADPVVRAGTHGLFYYAGLAFDRGEHGATKVFVSRLVDLNNYEGVVHAEDLVSADGPLFDPIRYLGTSVVASDPGEYFLDKPWMAVDIPRPGAQSCSIEFEIIGENGTTETVTQEIPAGPVYVTYTLFETEGKKTTSQIFFARSTDCGVTWSVPVELSQPNGLNQGTAIAVDPRNGFVYVVWRQFAAGSAIPLAGYAADLGNCTVGGGFWKNNPDSWPVSDLVLGTTTYSRDQLYGLMTMPPEGDATLILARQLITAKLNISSGAESSAIDDAIAAADQWLALYPVGSNPTGEANDIGTSLAELLNEYNRGVVGPGECENPGGSVQTIPAAPGAVDTARKEDAILVTRSTDGGRTFQNPVPIARVSGFDQPTQEGSFRSNAYPTLTVDHTGRVYVAWASRGFAELNPDPLSGDSRIVMATFTEQGGWSDPWPVDLPGSLGHQIMPSLTFVGGKLQLLYQDFRDDISGAFDSFVIDTPELPLRHTVDVRAVQADPSDSPVFTDYSLVAQDVTEPVKPPEPVSKFGFGYPTADNSELGISVEDPPLTQQVEFNPPNLPLFVGGTRPFMGDYIDLAAAPPFVPDPGNPGQWLYNTSDPSPDSFAAWTDNRDVVPPVDGDWTSYTPTNSESNSGTSIFDATQTVPACVSDRTGMRNQNIYTSRLSQGLYFAVPSNAKITSTIQRTFVVMLKNDTPEYRSFNLAIVSQPTAGVASFSQFGTDSVPFPLENLTVSIFPYSSAARTVYVSTNEEEYPLLTVRVDEVDSDGNLILNGLTGSVYLNPDPTNPRLMNPRLMNPRLMNREEHNTVVLSFSVTNPRLMNPRLMNTDPMNPRLMNPRLMNPDLVNPRLMNETIQNTMLLNPRLMNPRLMNEALAETGSGVTLDDIDWENATTDITWEIQNIGSTTSSYQFVTAAEVPEQYYQSFLFQLIIYRNYTTPIDADCNLSEEVHQELLVNVVNPDFYDLETLEQDLANPRLMNPRLMNPRLMNQTFALAPGDTVYATLRVIDLDLTDELQFDSERVAAATIPAANDIVHPPDGDPYIEEIPASAVSLTILTNQLPTAQTTQAYGVQLQAVGGKGDLTWNLSGGNLPAGLTLEANGYLSGTPSVAGNYTFNVAVNDSGSPVQLDERTLTMVVEVGITIPPGVIWTEASPGFAVDFYTVASSPDLTVAAGMPNVGTPTGNANSTDLESWTYHPNGRSAILSDIVWLEDEVRFVAASTNQGICSSGTAGDYSWSCGWNSDYREAFHAIAEGNGTLVAVGNDGIILARPWAGAWQVAVAPTGPNENLEDVTWGDGQFVAVGRNMRILTSPDGLAWTVRSSSAAGSRPAGFRGVVYYRGVAWNGALYAAVGTSPVGSGRGTVAVTSPDGVSWTCRGPEVQTRLNDIVWSGDQFIAVGDWGIGWKSADGISWEQLGLNPSGYYSGIAMKDGTLIAVGNGGIISISTAH